MARKKATLKRKSSSGPRSDQPRGPKRARVKDKTRGAPTQDTLGRPPKPGPGHVWKPGTPGVKTPTLDPFKTSDDLFDEAQFYADDALKRSDLDNRLEEFRVTSEHEKGDVDRAARDSSEDATDEAIRRGIFRSSIKDSALYDIEGERTRRRKFLDDQFDMLLLSTQNSKRLLDTAVTNFQTAMNTRMVENAQNANEGAPVWQTEPTSGAWVKANPPAGAGPNSLLEPQPKKKPKTLTGTYVSPGKPTGKTRGTIRRTGPRAPNRSTLKPRVVKR